MIAINKLKYLMLLAGISPKELSLQTQIERSTLIKILNGSTTNPRIETVYTLAEYFKVNIKELVFMGNVGSEEPIEHHTEIKDILASLMTTNGITTISLLTKYTGISTSILSEILSGNTKKPQMNTLQQIAKFFNVSVPQLSGIDPLPSYKTTDITPAKRVLPIMQLEQASEWMSGDIKSTEKYFNVSRSILGNKAYAINITDNKFSPDFVSNHILVVDNEEKITRGDFLVCTLNNKVSIFECSELTKNSMQLREAGKQINLAINLSEVKVLGVVVQQVLNRKMP